MQNGSLEGVTSSGSWISIPIAVVVIVTELEMVSFGFSDAILIPSHYSPNFLQESYQFCSQSMLQPLILHCAMFTPCSFCSFTKLRWLNMEPD